MMRFSLETASFNPHIRCHVRRHRPQPQLAVLLREGWRENGKVRKRTNLSSWPMEKVETLRRLLKNEPLVGHAFDIVRSLPHVAAVLGTLKKLDRLIDPKPSRDQVLVMIVARILEPASKLARGLATAVSTLASMRRWTRMPSTAPGASGEDPLAAPRRGLPGAPDFSVDGGVSPGQTGSFPGWQEGQAAVGLLCDRDGCRWKCSPATRRTPCVTDHHAAGALLLGEGGGRPGDRGPRGGEARRPAP